jgi:tRNA (adenine37-N6)-methyltransferase
MHVVPELHPIAVLRTPFAERFGIPRQSGIAPAAVGRIEFLPEFASPHFVRGLEDFSHLWLITGFHKSTTWTGAATVRPPRLGGSARVGIFASRSPRRPNGLGLSLVRRIASEPGVVHVGGVDSVDGTPIYDVKPYVPYADVATDAYARWAASPPSTRAAHQVIIPAPIVDKLPSDVLELLRQLLALELSPAHHCSADKRTYGMTISSWNIRWQSHNHTIEVFCADWIGDASK